MGSDPVGVGLTQLIRTIHQELIESQKEREQNAIEPLFEVASLDLELNFIITSTDNVSGKFDLKVFSIGGDATYTAEQVHKITLHLKAASDDRPDSLFPRRIERELGKRPKIVDQAG